MTDSSRVLSFIEGCSDAQQLENLLTNARSSGEAEIEQLAFRRLVALRSKHQPGSVEDETRFPSGWR